MLPEYIFEEVVTLIWEQITGCISIIKDEPLLLLPIGVSFSAAVIASAKGFLSFKP